MAGLRWFATNHKLAVARPPPSGGSRLGLRGAPLAAMDGPTSKGREREREGEGKGRRRGEMGREGVPPKVKYWLRLWHH